MNIRNRVAVALVWILSLVAVGVWGQTPVKSPTFPKGQPGSPLPPDARDGDVISGADVGFRVTSRGLKPGQVTGRMVVKINGQWTDVAFDVGITRKP
jgi:hypothetical protein